MPDENANDPEYDEALEEVLKTLRADYLNELPDRLTEMNGLVEKARSNKANPDEWLKEAHTIAHRLAGTAGSYGFAKLSIAAAELDQYLKKLLKTDEEAGPVANRLNWQTLNELLEGMNKAVPSKQTEL